MTPPPMIDPDATTAAPTEGAEAPWTDPKATARARRAAEARNHSGRRKHIDPATCERDYSPEELEFMLAMQDYKKRSGRMFPTWSEVLEILVALGYRKSKAEDVAPSTEPEPRG